MTKDIQTLKEEAKKQNYASMYELALEYLSGERITHDEKKAYHLLKECVQNNYALAYGTYANCLDEGIGCCPDMHEAFKGYLKAAEAGLTECYGICAMRYADGIGTDVNIEEALKWAHRGAEHHDISCLLLLADLDEAHAKDYLNEVLTLTQKGDGYYEEALEALKHLK